MKIATNRQGEADRFSRDAQVAAALRSPLLRLLQRSNFSATEKTSELLPLDAPDWAWGRLKENEQESSIEAQRLAVFNQPADQSTYRSKISVRTTRATAPTYARRRTDCSHSTLTSCSQVPAYLTSSANRSLRLNSRTAATMSAFFVVARVRRIGSSRSASGISTVALIFRILASRILVNPTANPIIRTQLNKRRPQRCTSDFRSIGGSARNRIVLNQNCS